MLVEVLLNERTYSAMGSIPGTSDCDPQLAVETIETSVFRSFRCRVLPDTPKLNKNARTDGKILRALSSARGLNGSNSSGFRV